MAIRGHSIDHGRGRPCHISSFCDSDSAARRAGRLNGFVGVGSKIEFGAEGDDGGVGVAAAGGADVLEVRFEGEPFEELEFVEEFGDGFVAVGDVGLGREVGPTDHEAEDVVGAGGDEAGGGEASAELFVDFVGLGVGPAGVGEEAEILGGVAVGGVAGVEGLVGEEVGAAAAVALLGGIADAGVFAGVVPAADAGVTGELLVVEGEVPAGAGLGDEKGAAVGAFGELRMADEIEDALFPIGVVGADAKVEEVGGLVEEFAAGGGVGGGDHGEHGGAVGGGAVEEFDAMVDDGEVGVGVDFAELEAKGGEGLLVPELVDLEEMGAVDGVEALNVAGGVGAGVGAVVGLEVEEEAATGKVEGFVGVEGEVDLEEVADGGVVSVDAAAEDFGGIDLGEAGDGDAVAVELGAQAEPVASGIVGGSFAGGRGVGVFVEGEEGGIDSGGAAGGGEGEKEDEGKKRGLSHTFTGLQGGL
jgi:hypothetical protein